MVFFKRWIPVFAGTLFLLSFFSSCEEEIDTLGDGVIGGEPFNTNKAEFEVFAFNKSFVAVQTNRLPNYQLGVYDDPVYGKREAIITSQLTFPSFQGNPTFGNYTQDVENLASEATTDTIQENETVKKVTLYLPYFQANTNDSDSDGVPDDLDADPDDPESDTDNDGVSDIDERNQGTNPLSPDTDGDGENDAEDEDTVLNSFANTFILDSIFSKRFVGMGSRAYLGEEFTLKVERSTYFLRDFDPNTNFEEGQEYFSNTDIPSFVDGEPLFEGLVTIDDKEIVTKAEDDPDTEADESKTVASRLAPGVQVELDAEFFQNNILNKEGDFDLFTQSNFSEFIRGLHLSITPPNGDLMLLFDMTQANITITYEYSDYQEEENEDGETVGSIVPVEDEYTLNFLQVSNNQITANAVNTFRDDPYSSDILSELDNDGQNASRLYLKGGSGAISELQLFDTDEASANATIADIKANNWVINEANLIFYVDSDKLDAVGGTLEPEQLYLFKTNSNLPIFDTGLLSADESILEANYGGILEKESDGSGIKYTVRITDYINDLIVRDSTLAPIGLTLSSSLSFFNTQEAETANGGREDLPLMNTLNPFGTVLFGNNVPLEEQDRRLKLQIFYTETD